VETNPSGLDTILKAKKQGHKVYFVSSDLNFYLKDKPLEEHPLAFVDYILEVPSTFDIESLTRNIKKELPKVSFHAIITFNELHSNTVAHLAKKLGVRGLNPLAADRARNKWITRELLKGKEILSPRYVYVQSLNQALDAVKVIGYPVIIKPVNGTGSLLVRSINNPAELTDYFLSCENIDSFGRSVERDNGFLIEEYIEGPLVSVETLTIDGKTTILGITERKLTGYPYFIEEESIFPAKLNQESIIIKRTMETLKALGVDFGFCHVEFIVSKKGPVLIEVNPRLAGGVIPTLIEITTGIDIHQVTLDLYLKGKLEIEPKVSSYSCSFHFTTPYSGIINKIVGWEGATKRNSVRKASWMKHEGTLVKGLKSNFDRLGYIVVEGESIEAVREEIKEIRKQIRLIIEHTV
jgi:biotin carboxylase